MGGNLIKKSSKINTEKLPKTGRSTKGGRLPMPGWGGGGGVATPSGGKASGVREVRPGTEKGEVCVERSKKDQGRKDE